MVVKVYPWQKRQKKQPVEQIFGTKQPGVDRGFIPPKEKPAKPAGHPSTLALLRKVKPATLGPNASGTFRPANASQPAARRPGSGPIIKSPNVAARKPGAGPITSAKEKNEFDNAAIMRRFNKRFGTKLKGGF